MASRSRSGPSLIFAALLFLFLSMRKKKTIVSLPIRNNNPFALIQSKPSPWKGLAEDTGPFLKFTNVSDGVRAGFINLINTYIKRGRNTIKTIFPMYAPAAAGNNPAAYIELVSRWTGLPTDQIIDTPEKLEKVGRAIERMEAGKKWVNDEDWNKGFAAAINSTL